MINGLWGRRLILRFDHWFMFLGGKRSTLWRDVLVLARKGSLRKDDSVSLGKSSWIEARGVNLSLGYWMRSFTRAKWVDASYGHWTKESWFSLILDYSCISGLTLIITKSPSLNSFILLCESAICLYSSLLNWIFLLISLCRFRTCCTNDSTDLETHE